ncbi:MAG: low molecular weight protein-tyrosine-phosphatase [Nitrospinaceae bacterium]
MFAVCFVCLGNICRSPLAQGVFEALVAKEGLKEQIRIASAGTGNWHVGDPPDTRMQITARKYGIRLDNRGRQIQPADFSGFDLILAMDQTNLDVLRQICPHPREAEKLKLFRSFDPQGRGNGGLDVPDPYYGGARGFDLVFQIVDRTCPEILEFIKDRTHLKK